MSESTWTYAGAGKLKEEARINIKIAMPDEVARERDIALMAYVRSIQGNDKHTIGMNPQAMTELWERAWLNGHNYSSEHISKLNAEIRLLNEHLLKRKAKK